MEIDSMNALKEIILDERRLMTYITVSTEFGLHVNEAKVLLKKVIEEIRKNVSGVTLNVNYMVSGLSNDNCAHITVCPEDNCNETVKALKTVFFQHVYSVIQGGSIDNAALASTNNFSDFPLCIGLIKGIICKKRSSVELGVLKTNSQGAIEELEGTNSSQKILKTNVKAESSKSEKDLAKIPEKSIISIKSEDIKKKEIQTNRKNGMLSKNIAGFFTKTNDIPNIKSKLGTKNNSQIKIKTEKTEVKIEDTEKHNIVVENTYNDAKEAMLKIGEKVDLKINSENHKKSKTTYNSQDKKEQKSTNVINNNAKVSKKRKRVLHVSDSDSEEEKTDPFAVEAATKNDSEDEIPPTPSTSTIKITSGITSLKKRRKIIDKTYTDEDGYILTRKEEVYESCSDNEEEKNTKENTMSKSNIKTEISPIKNKTKNTKKKISPQTGKQSSIMNFFKKK